MTRGAASPPDDFVAFVARRTPGLRAAAHMLSGNVPLAESLVDDLLSAVATRWRWFAFARRRLGRIGRADRYLDRIFVRESVGWHLVGQRPTRHRPVSPSTPDRELDATAAAELARRIWTLADGRRRRQWLVSAGIAAMLVLGVSAVPRPTPPIDVAPLPAPTALPPRVDVLPPFADQLRLPPRRTALPAEITFARARSAGLLSAMGVRRALAISQIVGTVPVVLGDDGLTRQMDQNLVADVWPTPRQPVAPLTPSSLSPDGVRAAFVGLDVLTVVDLRTAVAHTYPALSVNTAVTWLTPSIVLVSGPSGALVLDVRTGESSPTLLPAEHSLTVQHAPEATDGRDNHASAGPTFPGASNAPLPPSASNASLPPGASTGPVPPNAGPAPTDPVLGLPATITDRLVALLPVGEPATAPARVRRYPAGDAVDKVITGDGIAWLGPWTSPGFLYAGPRPRVLRDCSVAGLRLPEQYGIPAAATVVVNTLDATLQRALVAPMDATNGGPLGIGWLDADTALVRTANARSAHLLAWRVTDGELRLVAVIDRNAQLSVSDLTALG